jgi:hypothetical protein
MAKQFLLIIGFLFSVEVMSQTGIGTTTPNASAKLDVFSDTKGFLPPRVALTSTSAFSPVTGLSDAAALLTAAGLLVYNTATAGSAPSNVTPGYYYWNGTSWIRLTVPTDNASNVTGTVAVANGGTGTNSGSITGTGALTFTSGGTNQNINLTPSGTGNTILNNNVGIGATTPTDKLVIGSSVSVHDGGNKVIGLGWSPGSANSLIAGYPAEIRLDPASGKLFLGTDPTLRTIGSTAGLQRRMTITSAGNVGIGTENPSATLEIGSSNGSVAGNLILNPTTTGTGVEGAEINIRPAPVTTSPAAQTWVIDQASNANNPRLRFFPSISGETYGFAIKDNGYLGIGTGTPSKKLHVQSSDGTSVYIESTTADDNGMLILNANTNQNWGNNYHEFMFFQNQGTNIGSIVGSNSGNMVVYNTSSDYRLKTDFKNYNGLDLVNKVKTYNYSWKSDNSRTYGFIAHELQEVLPYVVTGQKDAIDADGKIIPQAVDYSKLTPILVKAVQELSLKIETQQNQIDAFVKRLEILESKK